MATIARIRSAFVVTLLFVWVIILPLTAFATDIDPASNPRIQPYKGTSVSGYTLSWSDEFNGNQIDEKKWYYRTGSKLWSTQLPANNSVSNGHYHIHLKKEKVGDTEYTGGGIISHKLFRYGYYETRMKVPHGQGWHPSFWMMRDKILTELPKDTVHIELDPAENNTSDPHHYQTDAHQWLPAPHYKLGTRQILLAESLAEDFHVFGLEFTPTHLNYFFDGRLVRSTNAAEISHNDVNLWLTCLAGKLGKKTTAVDDSVLPSEVLFDYVRFWEQQPYAEVRIKTPNPHCGVCLPDKNHQLTLESEIEPSDEGVQASIQWTKVSGPGDVQFSDTSSLQTNVAFSEVGQYIMACSATVGDIKRWASIHVSVDAPVVHELIEGKHGYEHQVTYIRSKEPEHCAGMDDEIYIGKGWKGKSRGLLSYSLDSLPANALIENVELSLWSFHENRDVTPIEMHELKSDFKEGLGEGFRLDGIGTGASWSTKDATSKWKTPGGDYHKQVLSTLKTYESNGEGFKTFPSTSSFVHAAQQAFQTKNALNLCLISPQAERSQGNLARFASNEAPLTFRPTLRIQYQGNRLPEIHLPSNEIQTADARLPLKVKVSDTDRVYWEKKDGPGRVVFVDYQNPSSLVFFDKPGIYTLQLSAVNRFGTSSRELKVIVTDATFHSLREKKPNILFIAIDDLRTELGCYGSEVAITPSMDKLASHGLRFSRAYCQQAICGPSRASILTGARPDTIGITHNYVKIRDLNPHIITLPEHFSQKGYKTVFMGKVYHHGDVLKDTWNHQPAYHALEQRDIGELRGFALEANRKITTTSRKAMFAQYGDVAKYGLAMGPAYEKADVPDNTYVDGYHADLAIATLKEFAKDQDQPFLLGLGFNKPHLNWIAPKKYWDLYDRETIPMATETQAPDSAPAMGLHPSFELRVRHGIPKRGPIDAELSRTLKHAYLACVSYVDAQIGRVMTALEELGLSDHTIILLWSDHGFHLGDMGIWCKATNYEISTRVPLILSTPDMRKQHGGGETDALVELVDMYPTLCDLAGITKPQHLEGTSFTPLIKDPDRPWKTAAFSQFPTPALREWGAYPIRPAMRETFFGPLLQEVEDKIKKQFGKTWDRELFEQDLMGYAMRTDRYRFIAWMDTKHPERDPIAVELYDHKNDPHETKNIAKAFPALVKELLSYLKKGWKHARPN